MEAVKPNVALRAAKTLLRSDSTTWYALIIVAAILGAYIFSMRVQGIFSCPGNAYGSDFYLAYCGAKHFGDYDHGAFWFGLEPKVQENARNSEVLFLGSSRLQFGFSSEATGNMTIASCRAFSRN